MRRASLYACNSHMVHRVSAAQEVPTDKKYERELNI